MSKKPTSKSAPNSGSFSQTTQTVLAEIGKDPAFQAVSPPLYLSSTYLWEDIETKGPYDYGRTVNPNRDGLARALAQLEGGKDGHAGAVITGSGMGALSTILHLFSADDLILAPHDCYGGSYRLLEHMQAQKKCRVLFVDQTDENALGHAFAQGPKCVLIETPSNPLMRLVDIAAIANRARSVGALTVCDNTFLSPVRQSPLALGCDMVLHSTTKYINGHSDVIGGAIIAKDSELVERLAWWANAAGLTGAPMDAWLALRGLRTLHIRMDTQEANAQTLAHYLDGHKHVEHVYYPGLKSHPDYALAQRQQSGPGAMLSFEIKGDMQIAKTFLKNIKLFQLAASLGGTESLI